MALSDRKKKILCSVVDGYIETANPVSSKDIQQRCLPDCSSATIRNELSALESMGYLVQPHVSAGRAPSAKAFRLYVDELMDNERLTDKEIELINTYFNHQIDSVEDMVESVAKVLTSITNYTSVVVKGHNNQERVDQIRLLKLADSALVVIVTDSSIYKDSFIDLPKNIDTKWVDRAEKWLNKIFSNHTFEQIANQGNIDNIISEDFAIYRTICSKVLAILIKMNSNSKYDVITEGADKIFEHPEYDDPQKAKSFISTIEHKEQLAELLSNKDGLAYSIKICEEDEHIPSGCSVVSASINLKDKTVGSAGVIGPVRMNYKKVLSVLDHINKLLDDIISNDSGDDEQV
ncbi:MAG: heat-inducible transcriptional repressor HrcA [Clostridia bacterium]|nr:heat-inducible transcriptional repressor HrcA [Clostridia bacterium]